MTAVIYYPGYAQVQVKQNLITQTITAITNDFPLIVVTLNDHNYVIGMMVRFLIPTQFGMQELNGLDGQIVGLTLNTLSIDIDSTNFSTFSYPSPLPSAYTPPSVIPNSSGPYLSPLPLPYGNQDSFEGSIYNGGLAL
jgi:hypothetical protein